MQLGLDAVHDHGRVGRDRARVVGDEQRAAVVGDVLEAFPLGAEPVPVDRVVDAARDRAHVLAAAPRVDVAAADVDLAWFEIESLGSGCGHERHAACGLIATLGEIDGRVVSGSATVGAGCAVSSGSGESITWAPKGVAVVSGGGATDEGNRVRRAIATWTSRVRAPWSSGSRGADHRPAIGAEPEEQSEPAGDHPAGEAAHSVRRVRVVTPSTTRATA